MMEGVRRRSDTRHSVANSRTSRSGSRSEAADVDVGSQVLNDMMEYMDTRMSASPVPTRTATPVGSRTATPISSRAHDDPRTRNASTPPGPQRRRSSSATSGPMHHISAELQAQTEAEGTAEATNASLSSGQTSPQQIGPQLARFLRKQLMGTVVRHRIMQLLFALVIAACVFPIVMLMRLGLEWYWATRRQHPDELLTNAGLVPTERRVAAIGWDYTLAMCLFAWSLPSLLFVSFGQFFSIPVSRFFSNRNGVLSFLVPLTGLAMGTVLMGVFPLGRLANVLSHLMRLVSMALGLRCVGRALQAQIPALRGWISWKLIKFTLLKYMLQTLYLLILPFLFFSVASSDLERALLRVLLHPVLTELVNAANRLLANHVTAHGGDLAAMLAVSNQFGISLLSRILVNNLESVTGQLLLSFALSVLDATQRINARDADYRVQHAFERVCCSKRMPSAATDNDNDNDNDTENVVGDDLEDDAPVYARYRVNHSLHPDHYDYYRLFGELCELVSIPVGGMLVVGLRLAPLQHSTTTVPVIDTVQSVLGQLGIEFAVELAVTLGVVFFGTMFSQEVQQREAAARQLRARLAKDVELAQLSPRQQPSTGFLANREASQSHGSGAGDDTSLGWTDHSRRYVVGDKAAKSAEEEAHALALAESAPCFSPPCLRHPFEWARWKVMRRAAKSCTTHLRLLKAWDHLPPLRIFFPWFLLCSAAIVVYLYVAVFRVSWCPRTDAAGFFFVPCVTLDGSVLGLN